MFDPIAVEVTRGPAVESAHAGAMCIVDVSGMVLASTGDINRAVFPRSSVKLIQALPLIETGAADALDFSNEELALICGSHTGETKHTELVSKILKKVQLDENALECAPQWPRRGEDKAALNKLDKEPSRLHNQCSGKHAGFLCLADHNDWPVEGYAKADHPAQKLIRQTMEELTGKLHKSEMQGADGCSMPTYALPMKTLAYAFSRLATGSGLTKERLAAVRRLMRACQLHPELASGQDMFDASVMKTLGSRIYLKSGAEGIICASLPSMGLGIIVKCTDGAERAARVMMGSVIEALIPLAEQERRALNPVFYPAITDMAGEPVGQLMPSDDFLDVLEPFKMRRAAA
jgi:L-asparaginase II